MAVTGAGILAACFFPVQHHEAPPMTRKFKVLKPKVSVLPSVTPPRSVVLAKQPTTSGSENGRLGNKKSEAQTIAKYYEESLADSEVERLSLKDYLEQSKEIIRSDDDGGPPRWFSPLECGSRSNGSPLLLFLPGIDGLGLGLIKHHRRLGEIFDIWCLHIPIIDRTPFTDLVKLVEGTVRSEHNRSPNGPIYLVGESLGGCLALAVAAHNPDIDLVLILSNPATCFNKSQLHPLLHLLQIMPKQFLLGLPYSLSSISGIPLIVMDILEKGLPLGHSQGVIAWSSYISGSALGIPFAGFDSIHVKEAVHSLQHGWIPHTLQCYSHDIEYDKFVLADALPGETFLWKLQMLRSASSYVNSRLHAVKAQTLILSSGRDQLLPSEEEGGRLLDILPNCDIRKFSDSGHALLLEHGIDLVTVIKGTSFYRHAKCVDYASDYMPPIPSEFTNLYELYRWIDVATSPVMISTLENGKMVKGIEGIPSEGPVLYVGYHMLLASETLPIYVRLWAERNIPLRPLSHPILFERLLDGKLIDVSISDKLVSMFDKLRILGITPLSATNLCKLLSSKSHVLLFPGGGREAFHRKGEEYKLFWPEQAEFVRIAAKFGAKIVPFGAVGADDVGQVHVDYDDLLKIPYFKAEIEALNHDIVKLRSNIDGEVAKQDLHVPLILPKLPGRFYFFFGKPIETEGRELELRNKVKAQELYIEVKYEVERCIAFLKEKRETDPYRNILPRLVYQAVHGFDCEVPTFEF